MSEQALFQRIAELRRDNEILRGKLAELRKENESLREQVKPANAKS